MFTINVNLIGIFSLTWMYLEKTYKSQQSVKDYKGHSENTGFFWGQKGEIKNIFLQQK